MRTALTVGLLCFVLHDVTHAQSSNPYLDEEDSSKGRLRDLLGPDFFDVRPKSKPRAPYRSEATSRPAAPKTYGQPNQRWDYRFDAQYQSTIKPHLRWYMRYDPKNPGQRYLPRHMTSSIAEIGSGGYGNASSGCSRCGNGGCSSGVTGCGVNGCSGATYGCGSTAYPGHGYQTRSRYWQHLDYLYNEYGSTPPRPRRLSSRSSTHSRSGSVVKRFKTTNSAVKTVWISRNTDSKTVSILLVDPPAGQENRFYKARATLTSGLKLSSIEWDDRQPDWAGEIKLANAATSQGTRS